MIHVVNSSGAEEEKLLICRFLQGGRRQFTPL